VATARRTDAAERDFENIGYQIAIESGRPQTAKSILREMAAPCDEVASRSHMAVEGTAAAQIGYGARLLSHKRWVILFRYDAEGIMVLRIADGSQDYLSWRLGQ
jgi:plasmid stabilization system protein ParE